MRPLAAWRLVGIVAVTMLIITGALDAQTANPTGRLGDRAIDAPQHWIERLKLPADLPPAFQTRISLAGQVMTLDVKRHSVRAPGYAVQVQDESGQLLGFEPDIPRTYQGRVLERPGSQVALSLLPTGARAVIALTDEPLWVLEPLSDYRAGSPRDQHVVTLQLESPFDEGRCGTEMLPPVPGVEMPAGPPTTLANDCNRVSEIAWDADFETYQFQGSDVNNVLADIDAVTNAMEVAYARDVMIRHTVKHVIVRTAEPDPYSGSDAGVVLGQFQTEWTTNQAGIQRDAVHLATGRGVMDGGIIGLAYVTAMCSFSYGLGLSLFATSFGSRVAITAHELGHNWSAPHCWDATFCGIMCGGCKLQFGPITRANVLNYRNALGCLDVGPGSTIPVPPNTVDDLGLADGAVHLDLLANDYDGNCDLLSFGAWDAFTVAGGEVFLSVASGPGGRDELVYLPPRHFFGTDTFTYLADDGQGGQTAGSVTVEASDIFLDLTARFGLDETVGSTAADSARFGPNGAIEGQPARGEAGADPATGTSYGFDGVDDRFVVNGKALPTLDDMTLAFWVWIDDSNAGFMAPLSKSDPARSANDPWTVQVRQKGSGETPGTRFVRWVTGEINGASQILAAEVPVNQFAHVTITHDGNPGTLDDVARIYVNGVLAAEDTTYEGFIDTGLADLEVGARLESLYFKGRLDDVQLYASVLDAGQVLALYQTPGSAELGALAVRYGLDELFGKTAFASLEGRLEGSPALGLAGAAPGTGTSIGFDGIDDRAVVSGANLADHRDLSLAFWIRVDGSNTAAMSPVTKKDTLRSFNDPWAVLLQAAGSGEPPGTRNLRWFTTSHSFVLPSVEAPVPVDQWVHVVLTLDQRATNGITRLYVDGQLVIENTNGGYIDDSRNADLELGSRIGATFFQGGLDDVQLYDEALFPNEVLFLFQNPGQTVERPGLRRL